jgi:hypothetical protein
VQCGNTTARVILRKNCLRFYIKPRRSQSNRPVPFLFLIPQLFPRPNPRSRRHDRIREADGGGRSSLARFSTASPSQRLSAESKVNLFAVHVPTIVVAGHHRQTHYQCVTPQCSSSQGFPYISPDSAFVLLQDRKDEEAELR